MKSKWMTVVLSLALAVGLFGVLPAPRALAATVTWDGGAGTSNWDDANNWSGNVVPGSTDNVILDNSAVSGSYTVNLQAGTVTVAITRLTIAPGTGNTISLVLPSTNTAVPGLNVGDAAPSTDDIILDNGAVLVNSSGASTGNGIQANSTSNGTVRINNGARYVHSTGRSTAGVVPLLSTAAGTEIGIFEYDSPGTSSVAISASGRNYGSLTLTRSAGAATYTAAGGSALTVRGNFLINAGVTFNSTMTAAMNLAGDMTNNGAALSVSQPLNFNGTAAQTISGSGAVTLAGAVTLNNTAGLSLGRDVTISGATLTLTSGLLTLGANTLALGSSTGVAGTPSASNMIVTDVDGAQTGKLCKVWGTGAFTYPIGDNRGTAEYSPVSFTPTSPSGLTVCFRAVDDAHPDKPATPTTDYLTRYWSGTSTGSFTSYTADFTFINTPSDVEGAVSNMRAKRWTGTFPWFEGTSNLTGTPFSWNGGSTLSDFTAFKSGILAVTLAEFYAQQVADHVLVTWETASELGNMGFNLYRGASPAGPDRQLNDLLIPSQSLGNPGGFTYTWDDSADLVPGTTYYYWLDDVDVNGAATRHGPVSVDFTVPTAVTLSGLQASPAAGMALPWLWVVAVAGAALGASRLRQRV